MYSAMSSVKTVKNGTVRRSFDLNAYSTAKSSRMWGVFQVRR